MREQFRGTGVAVITPFKGDFSIDFEALGRVIDHMIQGGVDYLVSLGTTGEAVTLTTEEKHRVLDFTVSHSAGRVPVVAGFGGNDTAELVKGIQAYHFKGISAILSASPAYNKPTQEGIYQHYKALSAASPVPIILYNVPGRTASNMSAETTLRLANDFSNIIAIKEASANLEQCMQIAKKKPKDFLLLSGDDLMAIPMMSFGAEGVISVIGNAYPSFSHVIRLALAGNYQKAGNDSLAYVDMINALFAEGNPGGVKCILSHMGMCEEHMRLPLVPVSDKHRAIIKGLMEQLS